MRTLSVGALSLVLTGCNCLNSPNGLLAGCAAQACFERSAAVTPLEITPAPFTPIPAPAKPKKLAKAVTPSLARPAKLTKPEEENESLPSILKPEAVQPPAASKPAPKNPRPASPAKTDLASTAQFDGSDAILTKAKTTIASKLEDPASAEFEDMKRAMRKNTFGQPVDTICGHVKGKKSSGENTGERPFLYLVKEDEAYVVDGNPESAAASAYRNICITLDVRGKESHQQ
jgi:hypothetical protein